MRSLDLISNVVQGARWGQGATDLATSLSGTVTCAVLAGVMILRPVAGSSVCDLYTKFTALRVSDRTPRRTCRPHIAGRQSDRSLLIGGYMHNYIQIKGTVPP